MQGLIPYAAWSSCVASRSGSTLHQDGDQNVLCVQVLEIVAEPTAPQAPIAELLGRAPTEVTQEQRLERIAREDAIRAEIEVANSAVRGLHQSASC